jgi:protein TonB
MRLGHILGARLRRHPLTLATAASLALHGAALAASHYLWRGTAPAPANTRTVALVMIEHETPTPDAQAPAPAPQPNLLPARPPAHDESVQTPVAPKPPLKATPVRAPTPPPKPVTPDASRERDAAAPPSFKAPPRRPPAPDEVVLKPAPPPPMPDVALVDSTAVTLSEPAPDLPPGGSDIVVNQTPEAAALPRYGIAGLANPRPRYPWLSRQRGEEGRVVLRVAIDEAGHATDVTVAASSGHGRLDRAAAAAVRRWKFAPARRAGRTVPGAVDVPVMFRLSDEDE